MDEPNSERPLRVLLAEDELLVAAEIEAMLVDIGCEVVGPVATVSEAERAANSQQLDGAILDVNLRGTHIFGVLPAFQRQRIPVILSSGYADPSLYPAEFRTLPLLVKPYDAGEFAKLVSKVFGSPAAR